jgi:aldose sugar dehydrogenase
MRPATSILAAAGLAIAACSGETIAVPAADTTMGELKLSMVAEGLSFPWAMAFLPSGDMLVTERDGRLRVIRDGTLDPDPLANTPQDVLVENQGGYFDLALDPDFADNRRIYMSYAQGTTEDNRTAVISARLNDDATALEAVTEIFAAKVPGKEGGVHFGSRLAFMEDGTLLVTLGDGFRWMDEAQDPANHFGSIIRIHPDGRVPDDNPDLGGEAAPEIWTYGHRNVQGLVVDAARGRVYAHEHGPKGGDELNLIEPATNYGWPEITYGVNYDGTVITTETSMEGMAQPLMKWVPSIAPSGMVVYRGDHYPGWQGDLILGAMNGPSGRKLVRVDLDDAGDVIGEENLLADRETAFRDVAVGPDDRIYLATADLDGVIYRLDIDRAGE